MVLWEGTDWGQRLSFLPVPQPALLVAVKGKAQLSLTAGILPPEAPCPRLPPSRPERCQGSHGRHEGWGTTTLEPTSHSCYTSMPRKLLLQQTWAVLLPSQEGVSGKRPNHLLEAVSHYWGPLPLLPQLCFSLHQTRRAAAMCGDGGSVSCWIRLDRQHLQSHHKKDNIKPDPYVAVLPFSGLRSLFI